jgi:hypothetical protein
LTASGIAPGSAAAWSIIGGSTRASIVGAAVGPSVTLQGTAASTTANDVTVQVSDRACTARHRITVRQPTHMTATEAPSHGPTFIQDLITYTVQDQFNNVMGSGICVDETVRVCANSTGGTFQFGDAGTVGGIVQDQLRHENPSGIPPTLCIKLDQVITAGGCGPLLHNTILFRPTGISLVHGSACAAGDPCP